MKDGDMGFVMVLGPEKFEDMALNLIESIERFHSSEIYVGVLEGERDDIGDAALSTVESDPQCSIIDFDLTRKDYKISANVEVLDHVSEVADEDFLVLLDSDVLFVDELDVEMKGFDLAAKPVDIETYWASDESLDDWRDLYESRGMDVPEKSLESTVDCKDILPYFNAGVVVIRNDRDLIKDWFRNTLDIYERVSRNRFSDQVALSLICEDLDVKILDESRNFPIHLRFFLRNSPQVLHYHDKFHLSKAFSSSKARKAVGRSFPEYISFRSLIKSYVNTFKRRFIW